MSQVFRIDTALVLDQEDDDVGVWKEKQSDLNPNIVGTKLDFDTTNETTDLMSKLCLKTVKKGKSDSILLKSEFRKQYDLIDKKPPRFSRFSHTDETKFSLSPLISSLQRSSSHMSEEAIPNIICNSNIGYESAKPIIYSQPQLNIPYSKELKPNNIFTDKPEENCHGNVTRSSRELFNNVFEACPLLLPTSPNSKNPDLNTISSRTVADLITNKNQTYLIVDCRYEYEYKGGHIKEAINITSPEMLERVFLEHRNLIYNPSVLENVKDNVQDVISNPRSYTAFGEASMCTSPIIIFHCEFSQKRGPRAFRALRNLDRQANAASWPSLFYPQIYVLEGGYRQFQADFPVLCTPENGYVEMLAFEYKEDYKIAREKEIKSWKKKSSIDITFEL